MKKIFIGMLIAVLAVWGFAHFGQTAKAEEVKIDLSVLLGNIVNTIEKFINEEVATRIEKAKEQAIKFGSVVGPQLFFESWEVNDVKEYSFEQRMETATTSLCSFRPPSATTTLVISADNVNANYVTGAPTTTGRFHISLTDANGATSTTFSIFSASTTIQSFNGVIVPTSTVATTVPGRADNPDRRIVFHTDSGISQFSGRGFCRIRLFELD